MMPSALSRKLRSAAIRLQQQQVWQFASVGLLTGSVSGCLLAVIQRTLESPSSVVWGTGLSFSGLCIGAALALLHPKSVADAARFLDQTQGLKDGLHSALQFETSNRHDPLCRIQVSDAEQRIEQIDLRVAIPLQRPRYWKHGVLLAICAVLMSLPKGEETVSNSLLAASPVLQGQTSRLAEGLSALKDFQLESSDDELETLVAELNNQLQKMGTADVRPEQAFAGLSEMSAALQKMQASLQTESTEAKLRDIGETLSLSRSMAAAGEALASGQLDRAARELTQLKLPELDRITKKTITEQLRQDDSGSSENRKKSSLEKAAERMAEGLAEDDARSFEEGARSLAEQSRRQAGRKKLENLIKSQLQNVAAVKAELSEAVRGKAPGSEKGGNQAGKGSDDSPTGKSGASAAAQKKLNLSGQNSGVGESETETESDSVQTQEAERAYRQLAEKYRSLSESAFETETVPPGHRQIIRRYFESIRPREEAPSANE